MRRRTRWAPGVARTDIANGELVRLATRLPSRRKTTRSILRPRTRTPKPALQTRRAVRLTTALPFLFSLRCARVPDPVPPRREGASVAPTVPGGTVSGPLGVSEEGGGVESDGGEVEPDAHVGAVRTLLIRLTWPLRASMRPSTVAPLVSEIEVSAIRLPTNWVVVPIAAELPTC